MTANTSTRDNNRTGADCQQVFPLSGGFFFLPGIVHRKFTPAGVAWLEKGGIIGHGNPLLAQRKLCQTS